MKFKGKLNRNNEAGILIDNARVKLAAKVPMHYNFNEEIVIGNAVVTLVNGELEVDADFNRHQIDILSKNALCPTLDEMSEKMKRGAAGVFPTFTVKDVEEINNKKVARDVKLVSVSYQHIPMEVK